MYKLIIADDEPVISKMLEKVFDWAGMGFEIVKTFTDGESVLKFLENNDVDVVLSDIRMNDVSGIDIAKYVYENKPSVKMVLMSAYQEFEYAKKAIEYKVENYLVKPINPEELQEVFYFLRDQLDKDKNINDENSIEDQLEYIEAILKRQFLTDCFFGTIKNKRVIDNQLEFLNIDIDTGEKVCKEVYIVINDYNSLIKKDSIYSVYDNLQRKFNSNNDSADLYIVNFVRNYIHVLAAFREITDEKTGNRILNDILEEKFLQIKETMNINLSVERISEFNNFFDVRFYNKNIDMIFNNELFMTYINECNREKAYMYFMNIIDGIYINDIEGIKEYVNKWYDVILMDKAKGKNSIFTFKSEELRKGIEEAKSREDINAQVSKMIDRLVSGIENHNEKYYNAIISDAIEYMRKNVQKQITLEEVAKQVFLNPVYFSRLFKEKTGINFLEYHTRLKIEKAKELLKEHKYKIYEVGEMIGYSSNQHFRKLFKEYTGFTPIEYRNSLGERVDE